MGEPQQNPRQDGFPLLVLATVVAAFDRSLVSGNEGFDQIEHRVPQPRFDAARTLVIDRVLVGQLGDDGLEARIDPKQRLGLRRPDSAASTGERGDEVERFVLQLQRVGGGQAGDPARCRGGVAQRIRQRPSPDRETLSDAALGQMRSRGLECSRRCRRRTAPIADADMSSGH